MMTRRFGFKAGIVAVALTGLFGFGMFKRAHAHGGWGHGGRHAIMKRMVTSAIDEVMDEAKVTPPQRATLNAARDRVFTAFERSRQDHGTNMDDALSLFESDRIDPSRIAALRNQHETKVKELGDVVQQAIIEAHDTLSPEQRRVVTSRIRAFHADHE